MDDIDWGKVQQIFTLLVVIVAPMILNWLKSNKEQDDEDVEVRPQREIHDLQGAIDARVKEDRRRAREALGLPPERPKPKPKVREPAPPTPVVVQTVKDTPRFQRPEPMVMERPRKKKSVHRQRLRQGVIWKEILGPPRALEELHESRKEA